MTAPNIILLVLLAAMPLVKAADLVQDKFFHLAGRDFSRAEAELFQQPGKTLRESIRENYAAAATIVLCSRSGIELSPRLTREKLQTLLLLMNENNRREFEQLLGEHNITSSQWLDQQSKVLKNQVNEAVYRWYTKVYGSLDPVQFEHIRAWYYRHQDIFRRIKLDPQQLWAFRAGQKDKMLQALSALKQGMPPENVRKNHALKLDEKTLAQELHSYGTHRSYPDADYIAVSGKNYLILMHKSAVSHTYLPLDETLQKAIGNALGDALAKARLAETLKKEFAGKEIIFY